MKMNVYLLLPLSLVALPALVLADDIDILCKKTPYPALCGSTIRADPKSRCAGTSQMGLIVVLKVESTVKAADRKARDAEPSATDRNLKSALGNCRASYRAILIGHVVASKESLTKGNYKFAVECMTEASASLTRCERGLHAGKSPVTAENTAGKQLAEIAAAIARGLL